MTLASDWFVWRPVDPAATLEKQIPDCLIVPCKEVRRDGALADGVWPVAVGAGVVLTSYSSYLKGEALGRRSKVSKGEPDLSGERIETKQTPPAPTLSLFLPLGVTPYSFRKGFLLSFFNLNKEYCYAT